jgi:hypothetical protein
MFKKCFIFVLMVLICTVKTSIVNDVLNTRVFTPSINVHIPGLTPPNKGTKLFSPAINFVTPGIGPS